MAKDIKTAVQDAQDKPQPPQGGSVMFSAPPTEDATRLAAENAQLKKELAELRAKASRNEAMPAHPGELAAHLDAKGKMPVYDVELPGFKSRLAVCPHCKTEQIPMPSTDTQCDHCLTVQPLQKPGRTKCANDKCEKKTFDAAAMVECNDCGKLFRIGHAGGRMVDKLQVPALSPGDAFERFKIYNGILGTTQKPSIGLVAAPAS